MHLCARRNNPANRGNDPDPECAERPSLDAQKDSLFLAPVSNGRYAGAYGQAPPPMATPPPATALSAPFAPPPTSQATAPVSLPGSQAPPSAALASPFMSTAPPGSQAPPSAALASPFMSQAPQPASLPCNQAPLASPFMSQSAPAASLPESQAPPVLVSATNGAASKTNYNPQGPCSVERLQAAFEPLRESAMALHNEAAGKEGIQKGLRSLYASLSAGNLEGPVQEKLVRLVAAVEMHNIPEATKAREEIVRTTTVGWVEGGTWQWALKQLIAAAQEQGPASTPHKSDSGQNVSTSQNVSAEIAHVIKTLEDFFAESRSSLDERKCEDIAKRLEGLFAALRNGFISASTVQQLIAISAAAEQKDIQAAQKHLQDIAKNDFQNSKSWLSALKQLFR